MAAPTGGTPMPPHDAAAAGQAPECQVCPICSAIAALREARPEAVEHLVKAGAELLLAARALLDGGGEPAGRPGSRRRTRPAGNGDGAAAGDGLQRIDVG
jgi:hypothetical protein